MHSSCHEKITCALNPAWIFELGEVAHTLTVQRRPDLTHCRECSPAVRIALWLFSFRVLIRLAGCALRVLLNLSLQFPKYV